MDREEFLRQMEVYMNSFRAAHAANDTDGFNREVEELFEFLGDILRG